VNASAKDEAGDEIANADIKRGRGGCNHGESSVATTRPISWLEVDKKPMIRLHSVHDLSRSGPRRCAVAPRWRQIERWYSDVEAPGMPFRVSGKREQQAASVPALRRHANNELLDLNSPSHDGKIVGRGRRRKTKNAVRKTEMGGSVALYRISSTGPPGTSPAGHEGDIAE